jgi:preprotein translocase subunit SecD
MSRASIIIALAAATFGVARADQHHLAFKVPAAAAITVAAPLTVDVRGSEVRLVLDAASAKALESLTAANVGKKLDVVVDDKVEASPVIRAAIRDGSVSITLTSPDEAARLAKTLR